MSDFTTPVGRLVGGSLYERKKQRPQPGQQLDPNKVMPFDIGVAIPKTRAAWKEEPGWGQTIYRVAVEAFGAQVVDHPTFASKITDGDSATAASAGGKAPRDNPNYVGHWILWFSGQNPPTIYNANGTAIIAEQGVVKPGYYVQVFGNAKSNGNMPGNAGQKKSGVYLNHTYVAFAGKGEEIVYAPDVSVAGFGQGTSLPAGAQPVDAAPRSQLPAQGFAAAPTPGPTQTAVTPNPGILPGPAAVPTPAPTPRLVMTAKAGGATLEQFLTSGQGWTQENLVAEGYATWQ